MRFSHITLGVGAFNGTHDKTSCPRYREQEVPKIIMFKHQLNVTHTLV